MIITSGCGKYKENELRLGFDSEYPPYGYITDEGTYEGFDLEYAKLVCEEIGYDLKLIPIKWLAKDSELKSGTINCIWSGFTINGREDLYTWSVPYADNSIVILVKKESNIKTLKDLSGKVLTTQQDSSGAEALGSEEMEELVLSLKNSTFNLCKDYN